MLDEKKRYECCHEAGHAVIRVLNGDTLLLVEVPPDVPDGPGVRGHTDYQSKEIQCQCGGFVKNLGNGMSRVRLRPIECEECRVFLGERLVSIYAASKATEVLMPDRHRPLDAQYDRDSLDKEFRSFKCPSDFHIQMEDICTDWAESLVKREQKAILALTDQLMLADGYVDGPEATRIIMANLANSKTKEKLRAIPGNEWNQMADPLEELQKIRHGEDGKEP